MYWSTYKGTANPKIKSAGENHAVWTCTSDHNLPDAEVIIASCIAALLTCTPSEKHTPSSLYTQNTSHLPNSAFHNIESVGSVRGFKARFASQLVQFRASERVSRVSWFSSGLQSAFRESMVQFGASERVTLHSLSYLTDRDFYFEKRLDGSAQSPLMHGDREYGESMKKTDHGVKLTD